MNDRKKNTYYHPPDEWRVILIAAAACAAAGACFDPTIADSVVCTADDLCPLEQQCDPFYRTCRDSDTLIDVTQVTAGETHTCILAAGQMLCWGGNEWGQLGYGDVATRGAETRPSAAGRVEFGGLASQVAAGTHHTCAVVETALQDGAVQCWGHNAHGQLGYGNTNDMGDEAGELPVSLAAIDLGAPVTQVAAGASHTCALRSSEDVVCWGLGMFGQLGYEDVSSLGDDEPLIEIGPVDVGLDVVHVAAGRVHTCASNNLGVRCWGDGTLGQLGRGNGNGDGTITPPSAHEPLVFGAGALTSLVAGADHTCVLLDKQPGGEIYCWGHNVSGQLGYGNTHVIGDDERAADVGPVDVGGDPIAIATGAEHTCAVLRTGDVRCWGSNRFGQLGIPGIDNVGDNEPPAAVEVVDLGGKAAAITAGAHHTCAILDTGELRCWGLGDSGQLGYGDTSDVGDDEPPGSAGSI